MRQASGSTPQKKRTIEGEVEWGQLISVFKVCVFENVLDPSQNHQHLQALPASCIVYTIEFGRNTLVVALLVYKV